jgi:hypothetical protein
MPGIACQVWTSISTDTRASTERFTGGYGQRPPAVERGQVCEIVNGADAPASMPWMVSSPEVDHRTDELAGAVDGHRERSGPHALRLSTTRKGITHIGAVHVGCTG